MLWTVAARPQDPSGVVYNRTMDNLKEKNFTISEVIYAGNTNIVLYLLKNVKQFIGFPEYALKVPDDSFKEGKKGWKSFFSK